MEVPARPAPGRATLPIILIAAVIQGWALYLLHHALENKYWPATDERWLISLYLLAIFVPITAQLLVEHARHRAYWVCIALLAVAFFYFGWHHGGAVMGPFADDVGYRGGYFPAACVLVVLWLLALPFVQGRLTTGGWRIPYPLLFAGAWRNKLALAEAALFTGLFWLLLTLWQTLFHMLSIDYFRELFAEPIFFYPVTALTFGCALHLIGSVERFTSVVLEQILNVLKWLALVAGVILVLFTIALVTKLPSLVFTGHRAIGATWLLWLVAVIVLLLNAAYRDGSAEWPYPKWIAQALRAVVPLAVIIALTAVYALAVRAQLYGLTVERFWAFVVAGAALIYTVGYALASGGRRAWLAGIARINVIAALALIAVLAAALTPLLSPYRLAANSQFRMAEARPHNSLSDVQQRSTSFHYLRFDSGQYGRRRLEELAQLQGHPQAEQVRRLARAAIAQKNSWQPESQDVDQIIEHLAVYPTGRSLDAALAKRLITDLKANTTLINVWSAQGNAAGIYVDLNGDGNDEFILLTAGVSFAYEQRDGQWQEVGTLFPLGARAQWPSLTSALAKNDFSAAAVRWKDLVLGKQTFRFTPLEAQKPASVHH